MITIFIKKIYRKKISFFLMLDNALFAAMSKISILALNKYKNLINIRIIQKPLIP